MSNSVSSEFLIYLIVCGLLAIFFLLYFNRLFGSIISYAIRTWTWHKYRVYIDIQALQISLLGGRIFFTGLRYHGSNETFLVQYGDITWRYWLRRVREAEIFISKQPGEDEYAKRTKSSELPTRITANLIGLEWFVYNRSPAYDSVLAGLKDSNGTRSSSNDAQDEKEESNENIRTRRAMGLDGLEDIFKPLSHQFSPNGEPKNSNDTSRYGQERSGRRDSMSTSDSNEEATPELPFILQLFPIRIRCQRPAAVIGNENTKAILIVKANTVVCDVEASETKTIDPYRQLFNVQFEHPVVEMRENEDYKEEQASRASKEREVPIPDNIPTNKRSFFRHRRRKVLHSLRNMVPYWRRSVESFSTDSRDELGTAATHTGGGAHWQGLSRYLDDRDIDDKARWNAVEYAAENNIIDSPSAHLTVFWDAVGKVTTPGQRNSRRDSLIHVNGNEAPTWGMHLAVKGGTINYGPWADRQRADLQRVFVPGLSKDAVPAESLDKGAWRVATLFNFSVELEDTVTLRIPIREESKNWRWRGKEPNMNQQAKTNKRRQRNKTKKTNKGEANQTRPVGWLEFKLPRNSTVKYSMDMLARTTGYRNSLTVDLPHSELWSSVNHDLLWRSGAQRISCDLSNPLEWNILRNWHFNISSENLKLYLLRDHIFLLIDLVNDWASGPPSDYHVFTPYNYHVHLKLDDVKVFFNVNDGNIIDNATSLEDNTYLIVSSPSLTSETTIPLDKFRPDKNSIPFDVRCDTLNLVLHAPQWNTEAAFLSSNQLAHAESLTITGSYNYNDTTSPANTDTLILKIHTQSPNAFVYGFLIRYVILLKDNYFGDCVHFRTLDEYQNQLQLKAQNKLADQLAPPNKKSNDLDVMLSIKVDDPQIMVPTNLYSATRCIKAELASIAVDLRFTNYYMDMELDLAPLSISLGGSADALDSPSSSTSDTQLFVDGIRVFGHRTFGLPPTEPTYLCNWDVGVGLVSGECTSDFLSTLAKGGAAFGFTFDDVENALVPYSSLIFYDITFIRVAVQSVRLWVHVPEAAFLISTDKIEVGANDWARSHYSKRAEISVPNLQLSCIDPETAVQHKPRHDHPVKTEAFFKTDIRLATIGRKVNFTAERALQQDLVRREDQRTDRTPFFILEGLLGEFVQEPVDPPAQCAPPQPHPIKSDDSSSTSTLSARQSNRLRKQSSFLSLSSHSSSRKQSSVKRAGSSERFQEPVSGRSTQERPAGYSLVRQNTAGFRTHRKSESQDQSLVTFSSPYFPPHFTLDGVKPDRREAAVLHFQDNSDHDALYNPDAQLTDINPDAVSEKHLYNGFMVEFPAGITAFVKPSAVRHVTSLLHTLQPQDPEDILDSLQVDTLSGIFSDKKNASAQGSIKDILLRLPEANIRFLNEYIQDDQEQSEQLDQYDLHLSKVDMVARFTTDRSEKPNQKDRERSSLQLDIGSAGVSAGQYLTEDAMPAVDIQIQDISASKGDKDITYMDVDVGSIVGNTASGKIEYLAGLVHRTGNVASELAKPLKDVSKRQDHRIKYCCCRLLDVGSSTNDPPFLIRPSAVLRSVDRHLRTEDSWKLVTRLRQIWTLLPEKERTSLRYKCKSSSAHLPRNAAQFAIEAFEQWRSWDLHDLQNASLLKHIFGDIGAKSSEISEEHPVLAACRLRELEFVLDPGPTENKIAVSEIMARLERNEDQLMTAIMPKSHSQNLLTILNLSLGDISVSLNWEICNLADTISQLYSRSSSVTLPSKRKKKKKSKTEAPQASEPKATHIFVDIGRLGLDLESVNLKGKTLINGFKSSVLMCERDKDTSFNSVMLNCAAVTSRVHSHSDLIWMFQLRNPTVTVSHELLKTENDITNTVKASASSQGLSFSTKQDIHSLLDVVDSLVRDEAAQLNRLKDQLPVSKPKQEPVKVADQFSKLNISVVMFLDGYTINVPLVQSLTYKVSGTVARAACITNHGKDLAFDFDIKENSHEMQINVNSEPKTISLLELPPTNGRVTSQLRQSERIITVLSSVETINLDASAIYSLLAAVNRPQITNEVQEIQQQAKAISEHLKEILGEPEQPVPATKPAKPSVPLVYDVHLTLAGFRALAKTSLKTGKDPLAQLLFSLGTAHMQVSNRPDESGPIMKYPELHLNLRKIGLDVRRGEEGSMRSCGNLGASITVYAGSRKDDNGKEEWIFTFLSDDLNINLSPETLSTVVNIMGYLGSRIKDLDTSRELDYLRKLRQSRPRISLNDEELPSDEEEDILDSVLSSVVYRLQFKDIIVCWNAAHGADKDIANREDLVLSLKLIELGTRTKKSARLTIDSLQLQMVPPGQDPILRSAHSALLPELTFNVAHFSTANTRRMAFQAVGKSLDLRLTSAFIVPAGHLMESMSLATQNVHRASETWSAELAVMKDTKTDPITDTPNPTKSQRTILGNKRLESLLIDADFAGAIVSIAGNSKTSTSTKSTKSNKPPLSGKYGQFSTDDTGSNAVLKTPGLALKAEYRDDGSEDASLHGELKVDASNNILYPAVVPLVLDMVSNVKEVVSKGDTDAKANQPPKLKPEKTGEEENILTADPSTVLGRVKLDLGLRICKQEFSLSCQPIARVAATTSFESFYLTLNTITSQEQGNFFSISGILTKPLASVQHVYSRESTASFALDAVTLSFINSKHVSGISGVSAILNVSPMKIAVNARQAQDFLLFREIWYPAELRYGDTAPVAKLATETSQGHLVQRYQQVAATAAFPWTATISIAALDVSVDLGQAIGKSVFQINEFWVSSKKTSDWEQNLCLGFDKIGIDCTGRLSGFIALQHFRMRTSIQWPQREEALNETPLVQASLAFNELQVKAAFDYQAFLVADITSLEFLMYNVRESKDRRADRLMALFNGNAVQMFGTTTSAAQAVAVYQAFQKLMQENQENFESSLKDIEKFMSRKSSISSKALSQARRGIPKLPDDDTMSKSPISLDTDVVVTLKALNLGVFPSTFSDHQVFKIEALNAYARFAASVEERRIHSILRMTLGQLRVGLAGVRNAEAPRALSEMLVEDIVQRSTGARGGTILKVPQVEAVMETWQTPNSNHIDYKFKSAFEGKVEVGWNYSRVSYIRGMWANHNKMLEQTWGRQLPMTAVKITGVPKPEEEQREGEQGKITAEVNVPQSKYNYTALEAPIIETPQLRDMGEATPPLEWIGVNRDRLPNLTHQIVIVSLLELAGEVEDAYSRILGSS